ncbi:hypothetical protein DFQ30_010309 [Apophysomyces sp. BC1015]|nr:hypothetical protein DFQ30_010309 [Apophysomyces sp. BC1015]
MLISKHTETPLVPSESKRVANALGLVPMSRCVDAYLRIIEDETLNGDIITVSAERSAIEPRYQDPVHELLDDLCQERKRGTLNEIFEHFQ